MILLILGAQKSPPNTYFFVMIFLKNTYWSKLKTFDFHMFYEEFTSPIHKNHTPKNNEKTNKIQTALHVTENRRSSKTSVFVTYLPPKTDDWTPPRDPPRSPQKVPKPTQEAPKNPQSSPRALQNTQNVLGAAKPDDRLHLDVTGHLPKKDRWQSTMQMKITPTICYMNLQPICPHCFKPRYEYTDVREYKKQPNEIAKTLKPSGSLRGRRQGVSL